MCLGSAPRVASEREDDDEELDDMSLLEPIPVMEGSDFENGG